MSGPVAPVAEPNVTPLIDVMLVLLILFMLVTPVTQRGLDTSLPRAPHDGPSPTLSAPIVVVGVLKASEAAPRAGSGRP
jgi:biopolymer transport protein TolR